MAPETIDLLHSIRGQQTEHQLEIGDLWQHSGYVFNRPDGSPEIPNQVTQDFARVIRRAGLPHLTLHGLRHAHATLSLVAGVSPKTVSERLGHSTIATTMDVYGHVPPGIQEEAVQATENLLSQARRKWLGTD